MKDYARISACYGSRGLRFLLKDLQETLLLACFTIFLVFPISLNPVFGIAIANKKNNNVIFKTENRDLLLPANWNCSQAFLKNSDSIHYLVTRTLQRAQ
jgi:hypothetical protein